MSRILGLLPIVLDDLLGERARYAERGLGRPTRVPEEAVTLLRRLVRTNRFAFDQMITETTPPSGVAKGGAWVDLAWIFGRRARVEPVPVTMTSFELVPRSAGRWAIELSWEVPRASDVDIATFQRELEEQLSDGWGEGVEQTRFGPLTVCGRDDERCREATPLDRRARARALSADLDGRYSFNLTTVGGSVRFAAESTPTRGGSGTTAVTTHHRRNRRGLRFAFERVGFRARLLDRHFPMTRADARFYARMHPATAVKELWRDWRDDERRRNPRSKAPTDVEAALHAAGFKRSASRPGADAADVVRPLWGGAVDIYTLDQIVDIAIEHVLSPYRPMRAPGHRFPVDPRVAGEGWFRVGAGGVTCPELRNADVRHGNVSSPAEAHALVRALAGGGDRGADGGHVTFFHATSWNGAASITNARPNRQRHSRPCLDFGLLPSFYLTPDLDTGLAWASGNGPRWRGETAVVVFRVPIRPPPEGIRMRVFSSPPNADWRRLTGESRRCDDPTGSNELDNDFDLVYGPMVANARDVEANGAKPRPHRPPRMQLASKSDAGDAFVGRCATGVLWIRR